MKNENYTIAIDLGQNSVVAVAGYRRADGTFHISSIAERSVRGVLAGRIENIAQVNDALSGVISDLEEHLKIKIQCAYGGISGEYVRCVHHTERVTVAEPNSGVMSTDVMMLHAKIGNVVAPPTDKLMESMSQNYMVDNRVEVKNPVGTFGTSLSSVFNFVLCEQEALKRLHLAFSHAGIKLKRCYANSIMAAEAVLSNDEKEGGVAVVDLGDGMTNVAIYYNGVLRSLASIPLGASAINHDIRSLMIQERSVEGIKCDYGVAIADITDERTIPVAGRTPRESKNIPIYNISVAIQERLIDIIKYVYREIRDSGYDGRLIYGIVLTGGGSRLRRVDELFSSELGVDVRVATPDDRIDDESIEYVASPAYATVVGILKRGADMDNCGVGQLCATAIETTTEGDSTTGDGAGTNGTTQSPDGEGGSGSVQQLSLDIEGEGGNGGEGGSESGEGEGGGSEGGDGGDGGSNNGGDNESEESIFTRAKNYVNTKFLGSLFRSDDDPNDKINPEQ